MIKKKSWLVAVLSACIGSPCMTSNVFHEYECIFDLYLCVYVTVISECYS